MSSGDKKETKISMSILHYNCVDELISSGTARTSTLDPQITLEVTSEFTGQYSRNWLYVSADAKSTFRSKGQPVKVPYRPDMVCARIVGTENGRTTWEVEEDLSEYRAWGRVTEAIIIVSGNVYGGRASILEIVDSHTLVTDRFYAANVQSEAVYLVPVVKGYYKACTIEGNTVKAEIETTKGQIYG